MESDPLLEVPEITAENDQGNTTVEQSNLQGIDLRNEALIALAYFALYLGYLFANPENEWVHWLTLVVIPFLLFSFWHVKILGLSSSSTLASFGLRRGNLTNGISWAIVLGLAISCLQLFISGQSDEFWDLLRSGRAILYFPLALLLLLLTAGFTEEFFFRGVMQTRLVALLRSRFWAIIVTSLLFGIYHLPYTYLNPNWPSSGDWGAALESAMSQGFPADIILGVLYTRTQNNLLSCVVLHSFINVLPAMTMIKLWGFI